MTFNCLLTGPRGSGKSWTAINLCRKLDGQALVIDTERSTRAYRPDGGFEYPRYGGVELGFCPSFFEAEAIVRELLANPRLPSEKPCKLLVIDSLTPLWVNLQQQIDDYKRTKAGRHRFETGMSMDAWNVVNRYWKKFMEDLRRLDMPLVCTSWIKDEWSGQGDNRKLVGKTSDCQKSIEYEFDLVFYMDEFRGSASAICEKSRYQGVFPQGQPITENLSDALVRAFPKSFGKAALVPEAAPRPDDEQVAAFQDLVETYDLRHEQLRAGFHKYGVTRFEDMRPESAKQFLDKLAAWCTGQREKPAAPATPAPNQSTVQIGGER